MIRRGAAEGYDHLRDLAAIVCRAVAAQGVHRRQLRSRVDGRAVHLPRQRPLAGEPLEGL